MSPEISPYTHILFSLLYLRADNKLGMSMCIAIIVKMKNTVIMSSAIITYETKKTIHDTLNDDNDYDCDDIL